MRFVKAFCQKGNCMKYIKQDFWADYLLSHLELARNFIDDIPDKPNKGIQFEVLVECLLKHKYCNDDLSFQKTQLSHDGNKDFWAFDSADELWWAECKNYVSNIALTQLAPTLVMAEINQVRHLLFFSYSSLNINLKKRIAQYAHKYQKEIFLFDDEALEQLLFSYDQKKLCDKFHLSDNVNEGKLDTFFFNELNSSTVNRQAFNGNYEITELNVGSIYDLNVILINRFDTNVKITASIEDNKINQYFDFLNNSFSKISCFIEEVHNLQPNQMILVKCSVIAKKECSRIHLPKIKITYEKDGSTDTKISDQNKSYICNWNKKVVLIGEYYETIIRNFENMCQQKVCALLVHGPSGTGKTRILEECETHLIKNRYNIINFIGFDKMSSWKEVVLEIAYQVFGIEENLTSVIACELEEIVVPNITDAIKLKIIEFLRMLKREEEIENLEEYYDIIFSEMQKNKYAILIDNMQSYSSEILTFLKKMLQFLGAHNQKGASFALLLSLNTTLVYDKNYLDFAASFQTLVGSCGGTHFECVDVKGFVKEEQAITYLKTLLCLDDYPLNYQYLKKILLKSSLKPKYIELIAGRLVQEECIEIRNNIGAITDRQKFQKVLEEIPPKYESAFVSGFQAFLTTHLSLNKEIEDILSCIYFFDVLSDEMVELLNLNKTALSLLCRHNILLKNQCGLKTTYVFEHDLVEMTLSTVIYPNILEHAIALVEEHTQLFHSILQSQYQRFALCKLFTNKASSKEISSIWEKRKTMQISNKFVYKFYFYFINNLIRLQSAFSNQDFMVFMIDCCKYVRDHVSEVRAEDLFEMVFPHIGNISATSKEIEALYFSFIIHYGENKIRLGKINECLTIYQNYQTELIKLKIEHPDWEKECSYAEAYINNRIFVCGKIAGTPNKNLSNWADSVKVSKKHQFWDIQFENYFDLANIYLNAPFNKEKALNKLQKGFWYYNKLSDDLKEKYIANYFSKQILDLLLRKKYKDSLRMIGEAIDELENNPYVNYHIFFREKYIKYKIINLMLLKNISVQLDKCMEEYEQLLRLMGHLEGNLEWLFLQAKYAFALKNITNFDNLVEIYYVTICQRQEPETPKEYLMLEELALKFRELHKTCSFLKERATNLSGANAILQMDNDAFQKFRKTYQTTAPLADLNNKGGYYV